MIWCLILSLLVEIMLCLLIREGKVYEGKEFANKISKAPQLDIQNSFKNRETPGIAWLTD
jgi:hypothetical protein